MPRGWQAGAAHRERLQMDHTTPPTAGQQAVAAAHAQREASQAAIAEYLSTLRDHSAETPEVREVRVLGARDRDGRTDSGYYADDATGARMTAWHDHSTTPRGTYITVNPCRPDCLSRAAGRIREYVGRGATTADRDIIARRWIPIDIDPERLPGIPATEAEHQAALTVRDRLRDWLRGEHGYPEMVEATSGNGALSLLPIDLPNDDDSTDLVRRYLLALEQQRAARGWGDRAKIDCAMSNAARIIRMMGLPNRKGDSLPARPHRRAELLHVPEYLRGGWASPVPRDMIESVARLAVDERPGRGARVSGSGGSTGSSAVPAAPANGTTVYSRRLDMARWLTARGREYTADPDATGTRYELPCVQHDDHPAAFYQHHDGTPGYHCFHDRCSGIGWREASEIVGRPGPEHYDPIAPPATSSVSSAPSVSPAASPATGGIDVSSVPWVPMEGSWVRTRDRGNYGRVVTVCGLTCAVHFVGRDGQEAEVEYRVADLEPAHAAGQSTTPRAPIRRYTVREMAAAYPRLDPPVIDGLLREREIMNLIAPPKVGKSWMVYHILLCLATGRPIFGRFATRAGKVLLMDNELPPALLPHRIRTVADAMGIREDEYADSLHVWSLRHSPRSIYDLPAEFAGVEPATYQMVALDAKYKMIGPNADENNNSDEARFFAAAGALAETTGSAWMLVHHSTKGSQASRAVTDVGSGGGTQARACDSHLILREHEEAGCAVLDAALRSFAPIDPLGLRWTFPVWTPDEGLDTGALRGAKSPGEERQRGRDAEADQAVLSACATWRSSKDLRRQTGMGYDRLHRTLRRLISAGYISTEPHDRGGTVCDVYRRTIRAG
jgi:hypothetical protein